MAYKALELSIFSNVNDGGHGQLLATLRQKAARWEARAFYLIRRNYINEAT
jgi:hypothetical protein